MSEELPPRSEDEARAARRRYAERYVREFRLRLSVVLLGLALGWAARITVKTYDAWNGQAPPDGPAGAGKPAAGK